MRQEHFLKAYARNFELVRQIEEDEETELASGLKGIWLDNRVVSWMLIAAFIIGCSNMVYAIVELFHSV